MSRWDDKKVTVGLLGVMLIVTALYLTLKSLGVTP